VLNLLLYSSKDCCLCDDAAQLIAPYVDARVCALDKQDIYRDKGLLIKYRYTIPVLKELQTGKELAWPFDATELRNWLIDAEKSGLGEC